MRRVQKIVVSLIISSDLGILLLLRGRAFSEFLADENAEQIGSGLWELPGGRLEFNETPLQAGVREASEETGIMLCEKNLTLTDCFTYHLQNSLCDSHRIHLFYKTRLTVGEPVKCSSEHIAYRWVNAMDDLAGLPMIAEIRDIVRSKL